jgi:hypothetical protein
MCQRHGEDTPWKQVGPSDKRLARVGPGIVPSPAPSLFHTHKRNGPCPPRRPRRPLSPPSNRAAEPRPPCRPASGLGSDAARPAPAARSAAAAAAGGPAGGGGGGGRGRGKMADGVDHIDIYADVGEEFNQVREGPGGPAANAGGAAARTLTGDRGERGGGEGAPRAGAAADRAPLLLLGRATDPAPLRPSVLPRRFAGLGSWSADAGLRAAAAGSSLAAASRPIVGGGQRALPAALGRVCAAGRTGRRAPSPAAGRRGSPGGARARRCVLPGPPAPGSALPLGLRFLASLHFVSLSAHGRLMEGRVHSPLYPARRVSWALLAYATRFGVAPCGGSPLPA